MVGMVVGSLVSFRCARWLVRDDRIYAFGAAVVVGGLAAARLLHVIDNWPRFAADPARILALGDGGTAVTGAFVGSSVAGYLAARALRLPLGFSFDITVIGIALGLAIGRIGDVINGEHHGLPLDAAWAVVYTHPSTLGELGVPVHLAVGYELVWDLLIFGLLLLMRQTVNGQGKMFWSYILLYGAGRFVISFYRVDAIQAYGLRQAQLIALVLMAAAVVMLIKVYFFTQRSASVATADHDQDEDDASDEELAPAERPG
jgi:phosphatidylglycerol:prolipoprotein diacylglycerol transferase